MPVGEFIAEVIVRGILEIVLYGIAYYTGAIVLRVLTLGRLRLAPLSTFEEKNRKKPGQRWDWSIWLQKPGRGKMLKADCVMLVGLLVWITAGTFCFLVAR